jgi:probable HAF family extracellular repeat protein
MRRATVVLLGLALVLAGAGAMAAGLPHYTLTVVGQGNPLGLNNNGQVVGNDQNGQPVVWQNGTAQNLDVPSDAGYAPSAWCINNSGQIAGYYQSNTDWLNHCVYWTSPTDTVQEIPGTADYNVQPYAINSAGQIVGLGTGQLSYSWQIGSTDPAQYLGGGYQQCAATSVNNGGQIVGTGADANWAYHALLWSPSDGYTTPQEIGDFYPYAINNNGQVVGENSNADTILWQSGTGTTIAHGLTPNSMNDNGVVVGPAGIEITPGNWIGVAAIWSSDSGLKNLNNLVLNLPAGVMLPYATAINNNGQILAYYGSNVVLLTPTSVLLGDANLDGTVNITDLSRVLTNYDQSGKTWAEGDFDGDGTVNISDLSNVLTNYDKTASASGGIKAVPEPSTIALLAAALASLLGYARRKHN